MKVLVIGGGHIGTLAGWVMPHATVLDWRKPPTDAERHRPQRWGAMYLHEPLEGIVCRPLDVRTTIDGKPATEEAAFRYKRKVGKESDIDSAGLWRRQFQEHTTGWEIKDFPQVDIQWDCAVDAISVNDKLMTLRNGSVLSWDRIISTIPLYSLLELAGIACPRPLEHRAIAVRTGQIPMDIPPAVADISINYISDPAVDIYRTTDYRGVRDNEWLYDRQAFTRIPGKVLRPGKIYPASWVQPMVAQLNNLGIFPVGRAGRWQPDELTHDSYKDLLRWARDMRA